MPGYDIAGVGEGTLLPWSWAEERLVRSHDYWLTSVRPDGRPHVMPVWGVWLDRALWWSSSRGSSKARNVAAEPRVAAATDNAYEPVVIEGIAVPVDSVDELVPFVAATNAKYEGDYDLDFYTRNGVWRIEPTWAFSLDEANFPGTPTRWRFGR
jgi:hypothetical protein